VPNFQRSIDFLKKILGNFNPSDYILDENADLEMKQKKTLRMKCVFSCPYKGRREKSEAIRVERDSLGFKVFFQKHEKAQKHMLFHRLPYFFSNNYLIFFLNNYLLFSPNHLPNNVTFHVHVIQ